MLPLSIIPARHASDSERRMNLPLRRGSASRPYGQVNWWAQPQGDCGMLRKSLIVTLGFLGLFLAGTAAGTVPASAGYACGPWNNWCRPVCAPWNGWCSAFFLYPRYSYGWYGHGGHHGHHNWGKSYSHKNWSG